jgi:hypothetical protein
MDEILKDVAEVQVSSKNVLHEAVLDGFEKCCRHLYKHYWKCVAAEGSIV